MMRVKKNIAVLKKFFSVAFLLSEYMQPDPFLGGIVKGDFKTCH